MKDELQKLVNNISLSKFNELDFETRYSLYIIISIAVSGLLFLSFLQLAGSFGYVISALLHQFLGRGALFVLILCILFTFNLIKIQRIKTNDMQLNMRVGWGILLCYIAFLGFLSLFNGVRTPSEVHLGGGFIGYILYPFLLSGGIIQIGPVGAAFVLFLVEMFGIILITGKTVHQLAESILHIFKNPIKLWDKIPDFFDILDALTGAKKSRLLDTKNTPLLDISYSETTQRDDSATPNTPVTQDMDEMVNDSNHVDTASVSPTHEKPQQGSGVKKKPKNNQTSDAAWKLPSLSKLLPNTSFAKISKQDIDENKRKIKETFQDFGIDVVMGEAITGPTVSQYTFRPASGIKLSRIASLSNDLALALAAPAIRMELPIPGQSAASIEIPNKQKSMVRIIDLLSSSDFQNFTLPLAIAVGQKVSGSNFIFSLAKAPHLLVAGATGAGKSVWINSMLLSLLYRYSPKYLQLILVDMKMVELNLYDGIPHLLTNVITDSENAINALKWSIIEMDRRYKLLKKYGKRNIGDYNSFAAKTKDLEILPYTVFVIDELADLMVQAKSEVEPIIARLTAMSRAVGIHLVLGTQRPDVNVVTGLIKTNVPTRVCFAVSSQIDSRVVIDSPGGETLLGQGDALIKSPASIQPIRFQGAFVDESEVKEVVEYLISIGEQHPELSNFNPDVIEAPSGILNVPGLKSKKGDIAQDDLVLLYEKARQTVIELQSCSESIISGNLGVDPKLAKRIIDELEQEGVVGPYINGSTLREVLIEE